MSFLNGQYPNYKQAATTYPNRLSQPKQAAVPMDPAMMDCAPPMDPSMMGGAPPMDPSMMGGGMPMAPPVDTSMMGMPPTAPPADKPKKQRPEEMLTQSENRLYDINVMLGTIMNALNLQAPVDSLIKPKAGDTGESSPGGGALLPEDPNAGIKTSYARHITQPQNGDSLFPWGQLLNRY